MQYKGNLYGRVGGKYIDLEVTADDYDNLKEQLQTEYKRFDNAVLELAERDKIIAALKIENTMLERYKMKKGLVQRIEFIIRDAYSQGLADQARNEQSHEAAQNFVDKLYKLIESYEKQ